LLNPFFFDLSPIYPQVEDFLLFIPQKEKALIRKSGPLKWGLSPYPYLKGDRPSWGRLETLLNAGKPQFGGFHGYRRKELPGQGPFCIDIIPHSAIIPSEIGSPIPLLGRKVWEGDFYPISWQ